MRSTPRGALFRGWAGLPWVAELAWGVVGVGAALAVAVGLLLAWVDAGDSMTVLPAPIVGVLGVWHIFNALSRRPGTRVAGVRVAGVSGGVRHAACGRVLSWESTRERLFRVCVPCAWREEVGPP